MFNWYIVVYEKLVLYPEEELKRMFSYIGEKVLKEAYIRLRLPKLLHKVNIDT